MGCLGCRVFMAFLLKFLNFIQSFIGVSMILYAVWMLNHWNSHVRPPPIAPAPNNVDGYNLQAELMSLHSSVGQQLDVPFSNPQTISRADQTQFRKLGQHSFGIVAGADLDAVSLLAPWCSKKGTRDSWGKQARPSPNGISILRGQEQVKISL